MLKKRVNRELTEPMIGLLFGLVMMIIVFLIVHFVFGFKAFS
ncbi:hypothetical protein [Halalkalibacter alkalisediminis]|uniref:Uncharacterized protein n=1 Tax=Halalkalibacter alkalisediminis TaxID=935616 RepID=A0ABV6NFU4_9BACI|nr:hypothetical protein [Halalkalibacter alkalisediminis]